MILFPESVPLPYYLRPYWEHRLVDPRKVSSFCEKQSHKTPGKPWCRGEAKCVACGRERRADGRWEERAVA